LQLAFAPLVEYLGNPALELSPYTLVMKGAVLPGSSVPADVVIPLDGKGAMILDWPVTSYNDSFTHVSFARFSYLEEYYSHIKEYLNGFVYAKNIFPALPEGAETILALFADAEDAKAMALETKSEFDFEGYIKKRDEGFRLIGELLAAAPEYINEELEARSEFAGYETILDEAGQCGILLEYLETELNSTLSEQRYLKEAVNGKFCILGRVDTGTTDIGVNPFHGKYVNVGTHGVVLDTILSQSFITVLPSFWSALLVLLVVPILILGLSGFKPALRITLGISGIFLTLAFSIVLFFVKGYFLSPLGPVLALTGAMILRESIAFVGTEREKQFIRKAFSTYLSGDVVQEIINDPAKLKLGGSTRRMTAIFTDIQGFSSISETLSRQYGPEGGAEALVRLLNDYLSAMSDLVLEQRGTIDKYEGDAIIAFFGAPLNVEDHALRACTTALLMKQLERDLNNAYAENGLSPSPIRTRIGINTGSMVVGNMGTQRKMDYTIMGNEVNLAARLEGVNKQYGTWILASEDTVNEAAGKIISRRLDRVRVVNINEPVRLYEILALAETAPPAMPGMVERFHQALDMFENRDWTAAEAAFEAVLNQSAEDGPAKKYLERCRLYRNKPPKGWDGVYNLDRK
jgi:adenylate cyclase